MKRKILLISFASALIGYLLGVTSGGAASAQDSATVTSNSAGDILRVCIDKKSGNMRVASPCKSTERPYVLGGPGPKGDQGIQGIQGERGLQGERGPIGLTGTVNGLNVQSITVWEKSLGMGTSCYRIPGVFTALDSDTDVSSILSYKGLSKTCTSLKSSSIKVYVP